MRVNKIIQGDCRDYLSQIPKKAYFISDPPYNQQYHYDNYNDNLTDGEYSELLKDVFANRKAVIIHYPEETIKILAQINLGELKEVVSWVYPSNTRKQHRLITWWNCEPNFNLIPQEYKNKTDKRIQKRIANGEMARGYDWWQINQVKNVSKAQNKHSCPIPEAVISKIILSTTSKDDLVVDPFNGSGTVTAVAKRLGRNYLGFDLSEKYCQIAIDRLAQQVLL